MPDPVDQGIMTRGLFVAALLNLTGLVLSVYLAFTTFGDYAVRGLGAVQLAWLIPIWGLYKKMGKTEDAKGVLVMVGITFLLSATCWGLLWRRP